MTTNPNIPAQYMLLQISRPHHLSDSPSSTPPKSSYENAIILTFSTHSISVAPWYTHNIRTTQIAPSIPAPAHIDRIHIQFLSHHPTIQDLI
ncbi:hypothetical protein AX14_006000 [Amanita brunnescens Koide BX004]|nr:hypothetical protein AX14_006000 [Amanita brunnescens Koide BX004]